MGKRSVWFKVAVLVLAVVVVGALVQVYSTLTVQAMKVHTSVKAMPPGIARIIERTGDAPQGMAVRVKNKPAVLTINTDIDFGTVFPGEECEGHFIVYLTGTANSSGTDPWPGGWPTPFSSANYTIQLVNKNDGYADMRPTMIVERDPAEGDIEINPYNGLEDSIADGTVADYQAFGNLDENASPPDTGDKWIVSWNATDTIDDFWTEIEITLIEAE